MGLSDCERIVSSAEWTRRPVLPPRIVLDRPPRRALTRHPA